MIKYLNKFRKNDKGATMVEYGLLVAVIAMVVVVGAVTLGTAVDTTFDEAVECANGRTVALC